MCETLPIRAFIVDDDAWKADKITEALQLQGNLVIAIAKRAHDVRDLYEGGLITPDIVDVAFIDSNLGQGMGGGNDVLRYLYMNELVRRPVGFNTLQESVTLQTDRIVTVGASTERDWASEIGSYSDISEHPLIINWDVDSLDITFILSEVRRLKPRL